jgi:hypothetical protein
MLNILSEISLCAVLAGLIGAYIGYLLAKENCNNSQHSTNGH